MTHAPSHMTAIACGGAAPPVLVLVPETDAEYRVRFHRELGELMGPTPKAFVRRVPERRPLYDPLRVEIAVLSLTGPAA